jgi:hypothetical protein
MPSAVGTQGRAIAPSITKGSFVLDKTLKWPFISILIAGVLHFAVEAIWPDLQSFYTTPVLGLVQFAFGIWAGYMTVHNGGNFLTAILYGALLGLFPLVVNPLSFGMILGRGLHATLLGGVFGFSMIVFGSLVGGGFAVSMNESSR